jgi:hypothetical protein
LSEHTDENLPPASVFYVIFPDNLSTDGSESTHSIYFRRAAEMKMLELPLLLRITWSRNLPFLDSAQIHSGAAVGELLP